MLGRDGAVSHSFGMLHPLSFPFHGGTLDGSPFQQTRSSLFLRVIFLQVLDPVYLVNGSCSIEVFFVYTAGNRVLLHHGRRGHVDNSPRNMAHLSE